MKYETDSDISASCLVARIVAVEELLRFTPIKPATWGAGWSAVHGDSDGEFKPHDIYIVMNLVKSPYCIPPAW